MTYQRLRRGRDSADHFDPVWVSNFLEHLTTQESVAVFLDRMHAVLAPGGRIAIMGRVFATA